MCKLYNRVYEPIAGDIVYQNMGDHRLVKVQIIEGNFFNKRNGRLSNFWKYKIIETGEIEEDYGEFYIEI